MEVYEIASGIGVRAVVGSDWALAQNPAQHNLQQQQREQEDASRVSSTARCPRGAATADASPPRPTGEWIKTWEAVASLLMDRGCLRWDVVGVTEVLCAADWPPGMR